MLAVSASRSWAAVTVTGIEGDVLENVQEYVAEQPGCDADRETVGRFIEELPQAVRPALDAFGYYNAALTAEMLPAAEGCWQARLAVQLGTPVMLERVTVELAGEAERDETFRTLFDAFPLREGDPLRHGRYRQFKDRVEILARQRGYLDGGFSEQHIDVYAGRGTANILLVYDSGPRYSFGEVRFDTDALSDEVLRSFLGFDAGDPYHAGLVARLQRELVGSRYFNDANVTANLDAANDLQIPVRITATADRATSYSIGAGYSTDDGPRLRFSFNDARRNRAGHQLSAEALLSQVQQNATFDYRVPVGNPQREWLSFRAGLGREDIEAGVGAAARLGVRRTSAGDVLTITRFLDALIEEDDIADQEVSTQMLIPGMSWARSYRDDLVRPREGHRLSFVASAGLASDVSLLQFDFSGKWVTATPWNGRVLIRGRLGTIIEDGDFDDVPLSLRFFAGGDNSVRGYDFESLGPRNPNGELIGGNRLIEASIEYEHPLFADWSAAVFVDSGNAFLDSGLETRTGAGIGARWFSPIGPVRLDLAWPLDGTDRLPELHLSLGPDL